MKAAVKLDDLAYVNRYIREFKIDDRGPGRILDFDPSPRVRKLVEEYGGIGEVEDLDYKEIRDKIREFNKARDWEKFHTPENLAKSISIESAELLECFQWTDKADRRAVADELADVMMYCLMMADRMNLDMKKEMLRKMAENGAKYPVKKAKGNSAKYTKL
ncbi:MAG: nucleotide pyrophosphohydrolase [Eubacterium sp.]|nr:nucleotide pyrophosphohydrolase [Candidatus Colimonas fimequi]